MSMAAPPTRSLFTRIFGGFIRKVLAGCMIALPIVITIVALYYVYLFLEQWIMTPLAEAVTDALRRTLQHRPIGELPAWWSRLAAPIIGASVILLALYFLGWLLPTRVYRLLDGTMMRIPLVKPIYQAVRNIFDYVIHPGQPDVGKNQRVVIVPFPHPGMRSPALVTKTLRDTHTGEKLLCVSVLTGVMPPSGFTLLIPERDVIESELSPQDLMQGILSWGITFPDRLSYRLPSERGAAPEA